MNHRYYIEMGLRLKDAREKKGYSLQRVGDHVGKSKKTIQNYETARHTIDTPMLKEICGFLDIDTAELLNDIMKYL